MKKSLTKLLLFFIFSGIIFCMYSCERDIDLTLPSAVSDIVIEGRIEPNSPPIIIVTKTQGYFEPTDPNTLSSLFIQDAKVILSNGQFSLELTKYCTQELDATLLPLAAELLGTDTATVKRINYCVYTTFDPNYWGKLGNTYTLKVDVNGKQYQASSTIHQPLGLDSLWFDPLNDDDSLGLLYAKMSEPIGTGNAYRWYNKRLGKDETYYAPLGSAFDDRFIDGKTFDFAYGRGYPQGSTRTEDNNRERGLFKEKDTIVLKFCTIGLAERDFLRAYEVEIGNNGNPFASPTSIKSNFTGGALGAFIAYSPSYDTVVLKK